LCLTGFSKRQKVKLRKKSQKIDFFSEIRFFEKVDKCG
jgi:hypothetical protein